MSAAYGALSTLGDLEGRKVVTEGGANLGVISSVGFDEHTFAVSEVEVSPGFLKANTFIPLDQLVSIGPDVLVVKDVAEPVTLAG